MPNLNRVLLIGHLGRDAEGRYTNNGAAICNFSLATTDKWTKDGQKHERTEWHNVVLFGKQAESLAQYLTKGKAVYVEGSIQTDEYTDKDGNKRKATKIKADRVQLMGGGEKRDTPAADHSAPVTDDDCPF